MQAKSFGLVTGICLLFFSQILFAAPSLSLAKQNAEPGSTITIPFDWLSDGSVVAQQFDLVFDADALTISTLSAGAAATAHTLDWQLVSTGRLRVVLSSPAVNTIASGNLLNLGIAVAEDAAEGKYPLVIENLLLANAQAQAVAPSSLLNGSVNVLGTLPPPNPVTAIPVMADIFLFALIAMLASLGWLAIRSRPASTMLSLLLAGLLLSPSLLQAAPLPGDANNDGKVDAADIPVIVSQILERQQAPGKPDCNQDSKVDVLDTVCAAQSSVENRAPLLTAIGNQQAVVERDFSLTAHALDPDQGDLVTYSLDQLPSGMSIDADSGVISWTPSESQLGIHDVIVRASDLQGLFDVESFQIDVVEASSNNPPTLIPPGKRLVQANTVFNTRLFATDPDAGDVLSFSLTAAPVGMTIDPTSGLLSWTPSGADLGSHSVTARVTDSGGLQDSKTFTVTVNVAVALAAANSAPKLTVPGMQSLVWGNSLSVQATASDADNDPLQFELINAPAGMSIDKVNGAINWSPAAAQVGAHDVAVKVSDPHGAADFGSFITTVSHVNRAPVASDDLYQVRMGDTLSVAAPGVLGNDFDPDTDPLTTSLVSSVAKGSLDFRSDGSFDYTPDKPTGNAKVELEVQCEIGKDDGGNYLHQGSLAVGDVDNDGELEIVGIGGVTPYLFIDTIWIIKASDCSPIMNQSQDVVDGGGAETFSHPGLLDIDGDGDLEIIVVRNRFPEAEGGNFDGQHLMAIHHDGTLAWPGNGGSETSAYLNPAFMDYQHSGPTFADLDGDGRVEILMTGKIGNVVNGTIQHVLTVYNSVDGSIKWEHVGEYYSGNADEQPPVVADLNLDGKMEVILHTSVIDHEGNTKFVLPTEPRYGNHPHLYSAVANFNSDPWPEIVARDWTHNYLFKYDGTLIWKKPNPGTMPRNQIAVADFDGDGEVEFAYTQMIDGGSGYTVVYDNDGSILWSHQDIPEFVTGHANHGENITAFDANGDGAIDIVIHLMPPSTADNQGVYIFDGRDGALLHFEPISRYSISQRFLTIADVDGDGHAELISSYSSGLAGVTRVWQGTAANPLPPAPPLRNQWVFNQTMVRDDATIISNPRPAWLQPGHNGYNLISSRAEFNLAGTTDSFTYKASDGDLESNLATVNFDVQPDGVAPIFLSEPDTLTTVGFQYEYAPRVIDYDLGDSLSFMLTEAPHGMTIDPTTGVLRWLPNTKGSYPVNILAYDSIGFATAQAYTLEVGDPVTIPDVVGQSKTDAEASLSASDLVVGHKQFTHHPSIAAGSVTKQTPSAGSVAEFGGRVDLLISTGPAPGDIDKDGDGFTPNEGDCNDNDASIHPGAADAPGDGIDQDCDGIDGNLTLSEIVLQPKLSTVLTNQQVSLEAIGIFEDGSSQKLSGIVNWTGGPNFTSASAGEFTVTASRAGINAQASITVIERNTGDQQAPLAAISTPLQHSKVTEPIAIMGSASDANFLKYELAYAAVGETHFTTIRSSTTAITDGVLAQFDPTLLLNDLYTIRLTVFDTGGNQSIAETTVQVDSDYKVGNFSLNFVDLVVPMAGMPIKVTRSYDSRDKSSGDFGFAWRLGVSSLKLKANRILGSGWQVLKPGLSYQLIASDEHYVSLTLPNGRVEQFDLLVKPQVSPIVPFPASALQAQFKARPGTLGTLTSLDNNNLSILDGQPGEVSLLDDLSSTTFDPDLFLYTASDGMEVLISIAEGVQKITDRNGNVLSFSDSGISHSAGTSISFTRDTQGRITHVTDPSGGVRTYTYDGNGDLRSYTDATGNITKLNYNHNHGLIEIIDPQNRPVARNEYDDEGRLLSVTNAEGRRIEFSFDPSSRQEVIRDADDNVTVVTYDDRGNTLKSVDALGGVSQYSYDAAGNQLTSTNPAGETVSRSFDDRGNMLSVSNALGATSLYEYDSADRVLRSIDPLGRETRFEYDARGNLLRRINAQGDIEDQFQYNSAGLLTAHGDANGHITNYHYDANGNLTEVVDPRGNVSKTSYDASGRVISEIDRRGALVTFELDANGSPISAKNINGTQTLFDYNAAGVLERIVGPLGITTSLSMDALGKEIEFSDAPGRLESREYDLLGNLSSVTRFNGGTTRYEYDALGRRTKTIAPDGSVTQTLYDAVGRITRTIDARGNSTTYEYDKAGRNTKLIDPLGAETEFKYDAAGNLTVKTDAKGNVFRFEYDELNRIVRQIFPDLTEILSHYDSAGNLIEEVDQLGRTTRYSYDGNNNVISITDPSGASTRFEYDAENKLLVQRDARGNATTFQYDAMGNQISKTYPDGSTELAGYDDAGRLVSSTDAKGDETRYEYDPAGKLLKKTFADGSEELYSHTLSGRVATAQNGIGTVSYSYDLNDRLINTTNPDGTKIDYAYDLAGNRTMLRTTLPGSAPRSTLYTYDALNRLASVEDPDGRISSYTYDAIGNLASISYPNGVVSTFTYDSMSRLIELEHKNHGQVLASYNYTLNAVGDRIKVVHADNSYVDYTYDSQRRLTSETYSSAAGIKTYALSHEYDSVGNRISITNLAGLRSTYSYDEADKLIQAGATTFAYDANGNLLVRQNAGAQTFYHFNQEHELSAVETPSQVVQFKYDAVGHRVSRSVGSAKSSFLVDALGAGGVPQMLVDYTDELAVSAEYIYGNQVLGEIRDGSDTSWYHSDASKNIRIISNTAGDVSDSYSYEAFGGLISHSGTSANPYQFAGEQAGAEENLSFLRARYYDPTTGRFISRDPFQGILRDPPSLHRYLYAHANPISNTDPTGQLTLSSTMVSGSISSGLISGVISYAGGKRGMALVTDTIIGAAFGALGGPAGAALGNSFKSSKVLVTMVNSPHVARFAGRLVNAIPSTLFGAADDYSKALANGDAFKEGFYSDFAKGTFLNLVFKMISGPSAEVHKQINFKEVKAFASIKTTSAAGATVHNIITEANQAKFLLRSDAQYVIAFLDSQRDEAADAIISFCWEFSKFIEANLPKYVEGQYSQ
ncbi:VCBS repeat-containing protein [Parahaliea sp. F7430]|uniref:VCBS repeat-containing protein n=1 Tax=Sediminihaliea albiluteola TaxID=2758564 RepID=A0A7W2YI89_9GAMM|nr:putative Ig domain-containing protein [Sediminihaliea albiluteola]MBA6411800.1 VCBS repeat-containing protein [Sediminihaliea albiluteola]